ncbi:recombinase family protein [Frisingicoccus sp.]|uniref:recombinase family protein n=1 Tax=Frisingicoccus sp. TaxID=1918627 RepID=UPI003AB41EB6
MQKYGYVRVSTREQNEARQLDALAPYEIPQKNLFVEKKSGKDFDRPVYKRLMKRLRPGDLLIVKSIDRLGRNYDEILEEWRHITREIGADVLILDMPLLDTRTKGRDLTGTFIADLVLQILSYVAQTERENIRRRQMEGIAAAKRQGVRFGRPTLPLPDNFNAIHKAWREKKLTLKQAARECDMPEGTFYSKAVRLEKARE